LQIVQNQLHVLRIRKVHRFSRNFWNSNFNKMKKPHDFVKLINFLCFCTYFYLTSHVQEDY
jgi:hypothetical protein